MTSPPAVWRAFQPERESAEKLQLYAISVRHAIPEMAADDLEAVEVLLRAVAARLRQLGADAAEAERSRLIALRRLGELLGPAEDSQGQRSDLFPNGNKLPGTPKSRHLARALASPDNAALVDGELAGKSPPSPSRLLKLIQRERATAIVPLPKRRYPILLADPPWRYDAAKAGNRQVENHYPTMGLDAIKALEVPAARAAVLFLWATSPLLPEALSVIAAWGFQYRTAAVWVKNQIGMGYYFRQQHELLLVGKRGELPAPAPANRPPSLITAPRGEHSAKPERAHELIEQMYPEYVLGDPSDFCELFQRSPRKGWAGWGNEV
jgi:N6-adenosine-specific RNA methylase IME4